MVSLEQILIDDLDSNEDIIVITSPGKNMQY